MIAPDLIVLGVLGLSALVAFVRGFVREVLSIVAWLGAAAAAVMWSKSVNPIVAPYMPSPEWIEPVSYLLVFVVSLIVLSIVASLISGAVKGSVIGGVNRGLGLLFGLARGMVVLAAAYIFAGMVVPEDHWPEPVLQARSRPFVRQVAGWMLPLIPAEYRPKLADLPPARQTAVEGILNAAPAGRAIDPPPRR